MHYKGQRTLKQTSAITELTSAGRIDDIVSMANDQLPPSHHSHSKQQDCHESLKEVLDNSTVTKELVEILAPLEKKTSSFVVIEGSPGIGKSVLLKEIAYRWANKLLLQTFKLVLLVCLRDPMIQQAKAVNDLFKLFCKGDCNATEIVSNTCDYLLNNGGKDLVLLLDGFDELPRDLQKNGLIADILRRHVLPHCGLVLSSRPHASKRFHKVAAVVVEILGFTEEDRKFCIEQAFLEKPQKGKELFHYLENHLIINSLCFVPFNMVILLFLHELEVSLPKNSTDMYNHFICLTICRHLSKFGHPLNNTITNLSNLPEPYDRVIEEFSMLSLQGLDQNKLIFTLDEIKDKCPDIEDIPGAINGFGLLQAVEHVGLTGKTLTFHFVHFSIQEYLAAYHITKLPPPKELQILQEKFWVDNYFNTFAIYVALTKGQQPSFKRFLSDGNNEVNISPRFINHAEVCFGLYHCFYEAGDEHMCNSIAQSEIFDCKKIDSYGSTPNIVERMALFLSTSLHKEWIKLEFDHIQDYGFHILYRNLKDSGITITELRLWRCGLTSLSSLLVSDIAIKCRVERLIIDLNKTIGENEQFYSILSSPSTTLKVLSMYKTNLSSDAASILFTALQKNRTLEILSIEDNDITDDTGTYIANAIRKNDRLAELWMRFNNISAGAIEPILQALQFNDTLERLRLPNYHNEIKKHIKFIEKKVNEGRATHGYHAMLQIDFVTNIEYLNI